LYVTGFNKDKNELYVGRENELYTETFRVKDYNLLLVDEIKEPMLIDVKVRYKSKESKAYIRIVDDYIEVSYLEPQKGVTPGQSAVFYIDDIVLGGGIIE
jgi:tRNA-specific 2-thiouridylase